MVRSEGGDPVAVASEAARHAERGDRPFEGRRVLVVEDEDIVALDLEDTLRALGGEALGPAASVARALALLARERPDAVTLGLDLLDGLAVPAAELLASMGVPFLAVSAYGAGSVDHPVLKRAPGSANRSAGPP